MMYWYFSGKLPINQTKLLVMVSIMIQSKFKDLEELQVNGSLTDTWWVPVFIHQAMLLAAHVKPDPVLYDPDLGEECGVEMLLWLSQTNTAVPGTDNPDMFHTTVPQTPHHLVQCLDMIDVSLSLLKIQKTWQGSCQRLNVEYGYYKWWKAQVCAWTGGL